MTQEAGEGSTGRVAGAVKRALNSHGYAFLYAVLRHCERLHEERRSRWRFEVAEFPVDTKSGGTRLDFLLYGQNPDCGVAAYLVCECKRVNPALAEWCFVRVPYVRRGRSRVRALFDQVIFDSYRAVQSRTVALDDRVEPYALGLEIKGGAKGESGAGRGAIEEAAIQVCRGVTGLIDFSKDNHQPFAFVPPPVIIPVVFTTARLFTSQVDLRTADLRTGRLPGDLAVQEAKWLWFQYPVSSALRHSVNRRQVSAERLKSLGDVLELEHARSIAVVNAEGVEAFLSEMLANLEDLQVLA
jgi:hypothetical protein